MGGGGVWVVAVEVGFDDDLLAGQVGKLIFGKKCLQAVRPVCRFHDVNLFGWGGRLEA